MDAGNVSAIISAVAGISGVLLGNSFVAVKERRVNREKKKKETEYLGVIVVSHLDRFANGCLSVALDNGTAYGVPAGDDGHTYAPTTTPPQFQPLNIDVEWKVLPIGLMHPILLLPDEREQLENRLYVILEYSNDFHGNVEYFWERRKGYAELGLQSSKLARRLREHSGMPDAGGQLDEWDREEEMQAVINKIDKAREAAALRDAEDPVDLVL